MSILVVWASPNQDGLTSAAKDNILKGLSEAGGEAEALHLNKRDISIKNSVKNQRTVFTDSKNLDN